MEAVREGKELAWLKWWSWDLILDLGLLFPYSMTHLPMSLRSDLWTVECEPSV